MKIAVIISSGIGNAVMMIPLLKQLKKSKDCHLSVLLTSPFIDKDFLTYIDFPADEIIKLNEKKAPLFYLSKTKYFDEVLLDLSASSVVNILWGTLVAKKVVAMRKKRVPCLAYKHLAASAKTHNLLLNLQLIDQDVSPGNDLDKLFGKMELKKPVDLDFPQLKEKSYFFIQLSSGNMKTPYKNWPASYWKEFLGSLQAKWPDMYLVFIGDENEVKYAEEITSTLKTPLMNLVGKTTLITAAFLLQNAKAYIGLDSGWMHLAAALHLPTFSIFGASSYDFVGYEPFDPTSHRVVFSNLDCWPCHAMIGNNTSRVKKPVDCPDQKCLYNLNPEKVFLEFQKFYSF